MLARSRYLRLPSGNVLTTPLLVPSFSSRGFGTNSNGQSVLKEIFRNTAEIITGCMLVSAYDIHYNNLPQPRRFHYTPKLIIVDSGGYEVGTSEDWSSAYKGNYIPREWKLSDYKQILDSWPDRIAAMFVNFDKDTKGKSISRQLKLSKELLSQYPKQLHCFLLKPTNKCKGDISNTIPIVREFIKEFGDFDAIGVTEKELGDSMLGRMLTLAKLRRYMDEAGADVPIQIFGALDPISSCLYFLSGAEIFDGLTWIRYGFWGGRCIYPQNYGALNVSIDQNDDYIRSKILSDNYYALTNLQLNLQNFSRTQDFSFLGTHSEFFKGAYDSLVTKLGGTK